MKEYCFGYLLKWAALGERNNEWLHTFKKEQWRTISSSDFKRIREKSFPRDGVLIHGVVVVGEDDEVGRALPSPTQVSQVE